MAKKSVATLRTGTGKEFHKVIVAEKSPKSGAYIFKEAIVHADHVKDFLDGKK
ncbi:MAG: hypothetical protein ACJAZ3_000007 [Sphingobacteriales bacterium]|jgi:hypothetical protein